MAVPAKAPPDVSPRAHSWRQEAILAAIRANYRDAARPPTVAELLVATGISTTSVVAYNLRRLQEQGLIKIEDGVSRGIRLVLEPSDPCPVCGRC